MSVTHEETNRIFLGKVTLQASAPGGVPAAGAGTIENLHRFDVGETLTDVLERRVMRFRILEVVLDFSGGSVTQIEVISHFSRINPAPNDYAITSDADADSWHSAGGQLTKATADISAGNTIEIAPRGCRWVNLEGQNPVGGVAGDVDAYIYGIMSSSGGGW